MIYVEINANGINAANVRLGVKGCKLAGEHINGG